MKYMGHLSPTVLTAQCHSKHLMIFCTVYLILMHLSLYHGNCAIFTLVSLMPVTMVISLPLAYIKVVTVNIFFSYIHLIAL